MEQQPVFNLWSEPWITVERPSGRLDTLSIEDVLIQAHDIHTLYDPSPLVVAGLHRLLVAILQRAYTPQETSDLIAIWHNGRFHTDKIAAFGSQYANRFDLFSHDAPFLQTADLALIPTKKDNVKPMTYLLQELPTVSTIAHYHHVYDGQQMFCSNCAAKGLVTMPVFTLSGGAGNRPSINGEPPLYVLPGGNSLFYSLVASLTIPDFQPTQRSEDLAWWDRPIPVIVKKKSEVRRVGYLHSLTFPARRIRLHPTKMTGQCTRCGQQTIWGIKTMVYEMGEGRPKKTSWWRDPFVAYHKPKKDKPPMPIKPSKSRAIWQEFTGLFLPDREDELGFKAFRPAIIEQLNDIWYEDKNLLPSSHFPFRIIGLRHERGQMKIFEWEETGFAIAPRLLADEEMADFIQKGLDFAASIDGKIRHVFNDHFGGGGKSSRYDT
ncbi:MAG: type I-E CRISPR-associated protein Cse1/CasA, partial [Chloroflexi bacterium]